MRRFLFVAACLSQIDLYNYGCTLLCRHEGISAQGLWDEVKKECICQVPAQFEAMTEKRLKLRTKRSDKRTVLSSE